MKVVVSLKPRGGKKGRRYIQFTLSRRNGILRCRAKKHDPICSIGVRGNMRQRIPLKKKRPHKF